ncbi:MAG: PD-(D/E)XK nuclease family protein [Actinomycetota bacterium]|nr:PD-(D/E)XK nuclease family protein [Actinomycetota bacterium]
MSIRISYSAASAFERCPLSYRYQYVERIDIEPTPALSFGRSIHSALEWLYDREVPRPPSLQELLEYLESCWDCQGYGDAEEEESYLEHGREILTRFYESNIDDFRLPVAVEHRFELDMDGYLLTGVIDRVDRNADGGYEIIDYKTNRRLPDLNRLREDLQLPIYQMACLETWGVNPGKLTYYYLLPNQRYATRAYDSNGLARVRKRLDSVIEAIEKGEFESRPNRLCPWCSYRDICPDRAEGNSEREKLRRRHSSLLKRRDGLERVIRELEEEMRDRGISDNGSSDT